MVFVFLWMLGTLSLGEEGLGCFFAIFGSIFVACLVWFNHWIFEVGRAFGAFSFMAEMIAFGLVFLWTLDFGRRAERKKEEQRLRGEDWKKKVAEDQNGRPDDGT